MTRMLSVLAATQGARGDRKNLFLSSNDCEGEEPELHCNITDDEPYLLEDFKWNNFSKVIIRNAKDLLLNDPSCQGKDRREVAVYNSDRVTTQPGKSKCSQQLYLYNCRNVKVIGGVDLVYMNNSEAEEISLKRVSQLDLESSFVREVSVHVDGKHSIIQNSSIEVVKKLEMEGDFVYRVEHSYLGKMEGFISNTTKDSTFENVAVEEVAAGGFVILGGKVTITNSVFEHTEPKGLVVESILVIQDCAFYSLAYNSILLRENATIHFLNVTVAKEREIFFSVSGGTVGLFPLAILGQFRVVLQSHWVVLYLIIGLLAGSVAATLITYYRLRKRGSVTEVEMPERLKKKSIPGPRGESKQPRSHNNNSTPTATVPTRPLPAIPPDRKMYQKYSELARQQPPREAPRAPPPGINKISSSNGSTLPKSVPKLPNPPISRAPTTSESHDGRNNLLSPSPEEEYDLYVDLASVRKISGPPPIPPPNKPMMPPCHKKPPPPLAPQKKY